MNIEEHLAGMTDAQLIAAFKEAESDLKKAATEQPESEWHQSCFAGLLVFAGELSKRGIRLSPLH
jgi:hypothetical protein